MDDLISRRAAIDEITEYGSGDTIYMSVGELKRRIEHLPSAQQVKTEMSSAEERPAESVQNVSNEDLISRKAAVDALCRGCSGCCIPCDPFPCREVETIQNLPSAQPEPCEDAVSRHRLLNDLKELTTAWEKYPVMAEQIKGVEATIGYVKAIPSAQSKQRWIPCSERLPEEKDAGILKKLGTNKRSDYVLATVEVKGERMTVTACTYDGTWDWNMKYAFPDFKVVAWMPLPEPYAERRT